MDLSPLVLFFRQAMQRNSIWVLPSQQRLHKLRFLQKLGCHKPSWDQARLSSLVNKQVGHTAHCTPHTINYTLHTTHYMIHNTHYALKTTHFTLYSKHYTLNFTLFIRLGVSGGRPDPSNHWHQPQAPPATSASRSRTEASENSWQCSSVFDSTTESSSRKRKRAAGNK